MLLSLVNLLQFCEYQLEMIVLRVSFKPLIQENGSNLFILYGSEFEMSFLSFCLQRKICVLLGYVQK